MTREELKELVTAMRELGVTRFQDGGVVIELAPAPPAPSPEKDPTKPDYPASLPATSEQKKLHMLFKHSSLKPYRRAAPHEK